MSDMPDAPLTERLEIVLTALKRYGIPCIEDAITAARRSDELNVMLGEMRIQSGALENDRNGLQRQLDDALLDNARLRGQITSGLSGDLKTALSERDKAVGQVQEFRKRLAKLETESTAKDLLIVELKTRVKLLSDEVTVQRDRHNRVLDVFKKRSDLADGTSQV